MFELYIDLFRGLPRFAPGGDELTLQALQRLGIPPAGGLIADMGCGEGSSALVLARNTPCQIVAFDLEPTYVEGLRALAEEAGLLDRIQTVVADFAEAPLDPASVDLLWAEGSVYNLGFGPGLATWHRHLKPGAGIAVSELTWISDEHCEGATQFFAEAYPAMTTIDENVASMRAAGFDVLDPIVFPPSAWEDEFYTPLERAIPAFLKRHGNTHDAQEVASVVRTEIETYRECGDCYSYVFYLGRAV
ncbi:MAG: class I SAM-dependent methyltransferase [Dermatophilus congolensis]|nr:class I SAM-dependent methyltransferase [Dermatophilus congolensis]